MNFWNLVQAGLLIWQEIAKQTKYTGDEKVVSEIQAVLPHLKAIANSDVYKSQVKKTSRVWPQP